jgi:hypothetical protein
VRKYPERQTYSFPLISECFEHRTEENTWLNVLKNWSSDRLTELLGEFEVFDGAIDEDDKTARDKFWYSLCFCPEEFLSEDAAKNVEKCRRNVFNEMFEEIMSVASFYLGRRPLQVTIPDDRVDSDVIPWPRKGVPQVIRTRETVRADRPFLSDDRPVTVAYSGSDWFCFSNPKGEVWIIFPNGERVAVKSGQYEVIAWSDDEVMIEQ